MIGALGLMSSTGRGAHGISEMVDDDDDDHGAPAVTRDRTGPDHHTSQPSSARPRRRATRARARWCAASCICERALRRKPPYSARRERGIGLGSGCMRRSPVCVCCRQRACLGPRRRCGRAPNDLLACPRGMPVHDSLVAGVESRVSRSRKWPRARIKAALRAGRRKRPAPREEEVSTSRRLALTTCLMGLRSHQ